MIIFDSEISSSSVVIDTFFPELNTLEIRYISLYILFYLIRR